MPKSKSSQIAQEEAELLMTHLALAERVAGRLRKVLTRKAPLFEVPGQTIAIPKGPLRLEELEFLDDEFKRLIGDAVAARVRLHSIIAIEKVTSKRKKR